MKFRLPGSSGNSGTSESSSTLNRQAEPGKQVSSGSISRTEPANSTGSAARSVVSSTVEEIPVNNGRAPTRLSLEAERLSQPRNGRPSITLLDTARANREAASSISSTNGYAFQVPETPPRNTGLGKHLLQFDKSFSLNAADDTTAKDAVLPFPLVEDDAARHVVCQDSLMPWTYLLNIPGKNIRDVLIDAFNEWLKCGKSNLDVIKQVVGYLHTGSLIIDDIEDESLTRRGEPSAHVVYGIAPALNAGNCK